MISSPLFSPSIRISGFVPVNLRAMTQLTIDVILGLIVDLDLAPVNDMASEFYDVHWLEVLALEDARRDLDNMSWRNSHIHLRKRDPFYVHASDSSDLFATVEQTK